MDKKKIKNALENILTDFQMLLDGCEPELEAFEASIEQVELIADELGIEIESHYESDDEEDF